MLEEFARVARGVAMAAPSIPLVSNLTGAPVADETICSAEYWVSQVRQPVRFYGGVRWLQDNGVSALLELGPDAVLSSMSYECLSHSGDEPAGEEGDERPVAVSALRVKRRERETLLDALARLWVHGCELDWTPALERLEAQRVELPTYPFQRRRLWLQGEQGSAGVAAAGLASAEHPLLSAVIELADGAGGVLTGRISLDSHPWLADHRIMGAVLMPGTALLELALHAGRRFGCARVEELILVAPMSLPEQGALQVQVLVSQSPDSERLSVVIHSRRQDGAEGEGEWTRHASGTLAELGVGVESGEAAWRRESWPPPGAEALELDDYYERLADLGLEYGPRFRALRAVWRRGEELFVEVGLEGERLAGEGRFHAHPALLDAVLQAAGVDLGAGEEGLRLPFSWSGVELGAGGADASSLRASLRRTSEGFVVRVADSDGAVVLGAEAVSLRQVLEAQPGGAGAARGALLGLGWRALEEEGPRRLLRDRSAGGSHDRRARGCAGAGARRGRRGGSAGLRRGLGADRGAGWRCGGAGGAAGGLHGTAGAHPGERRGGDLEWLPRS